MSGGHGVRENDRGISLVEVLVSLILLSIALSALAGLTYQVAQRSYDSSTETYANGVATEQLGRLSVLPYDSLPGQAGCVDVTDVTFPHERCVSVSSLTPKMREVMLVITPDMPFSDPDTVIFRRSKPASASPFN